MQKANQVRSTYGGDYVAGQDFEQGASLRVVGAQNPLRAQQYYNETYYLSDGGSEDDEGYRQQKTAWRRNYPDSFLPGPGPSELEHVYKTSPVIMFPGPQSTAANNYVNTEYVDEFVRCVDPVLRGLSDLQVWQTIQYMRDMGGQLHNLSPCACTVDPI